MNYKGLVVLLFGGILLILFMLALVSNMYKDMMQIYLEAEYVTITVEEDVMTVKCILGYHNPERKNVPKHFKFPVAYAQNYSTPENIEVWMPQVTEQPVITEKGAAIEWSGSMGEQERVDIKIQYKQKILLDQIFFPLVSDFFPRADLTTVRYKIVLPYTANNIRSSFSDVKVQERDDKVIVTFEGKAFTPDQDLVIEWD